MYDMGIHLYGLDISKLSLSRVRHWCIRAYSPDNMKMLPKDAFDLAVSFFVAQHMTNEDLEEQFKCVIPSLKSDGILAVHYLEPLDTDVVPDFHQKILTPPGRVLRSRGQMTKIIFCAGGTVGEIIRDTPHPKMQLREMGLHIKKRG